MFFVIVSGVAGGLGARLPLRGALVFCAGVVGICALLGGHSANNGSTPVPSYLAAAAAIAVVFLGVPARDLATASDGGRSVGTFNGWASAQRRKPKLKPGRYSRVQRPARSPARRAR